jgi:WD40 repeat protein
VIAALGGVIALHQRGSARSEARAAEAQRLGAQALTDLRLDRSLLLARQGVALDDSPITRSNLLADLLRTPAAIGVIGGDGSPLDALGLSPDGRTLAAADNQGRVVFLDPVTRRPVGRPYTALSPIIAVTYSPDGRVLALSGGDYIDVLDGRTHAYRRRLFADRGLGHEVAQPGRSPGLFGTVVFSPDSRVLATDIGVYRHRDDVVRWDPATGRQLGPARPVASTAVPALVGFLGRGRKVVTTSGRERRTVVRDALTMRPVRQFHGGGGPHALSPDGHLLALGAADGSVRLLDLQTGKLRATAGRHDAAVDDVRFTPDSRTLVTAGRDGRVDVWSVSDATRTDTFEGHAGAVSSIATSPDGRTVYSAGEDGNVVEWDLTGTRRLGRSFTTPRPRPRRPPAPSPRVPLAVTPDQTRFAVPDTAGRVDLFDSRTLTQTGRIPVSPGTPATGVALARDGQTMAATTADGHLRFGDLSTSRPVGQLLRDHDDEAWAPAFSGDGRWLATAGLDGTVHLWDMRHRRMVGTYFVLEGFAINLSISLDGTKLAATIDGPQGHALEIISVPQLELLTTVRAPVGDWGQFSRDGRTLLYGDDAGRTWLYDTRTWRPRGRPFAGATGPVLTVDLSPDGRMLAATSTDGTTRLWDVASHRPIGAALPGIADHDVASAFVEGGSHLITVYDNGRAYSWDVRPRSWAQTACDIAGRTLTPAEWQDTLPNLAYTPACGR